MKLFQPIAFLIYLNYVLGNDPCFQYSTKIESPCNEVIEEAESYELRKYATVQNEFYADALVETDLFLVASTMGFSENFAYISGRNSKNATIPMTSPVIFRELRSDSADENSALRWHVGFFVPSTYEDIKNVPVPDSTNINIVSIPSNAVFAVAEFDGFATEMQFQRRTRDLLARLKRDNIKVVNDDWKKVWASYDSPFVLFNRHNEVWIHVEDPGLSFSPYGTLSTQ